MSTVRWKAIASGAELYVMAGLLVGALAIKAEYLAEVIHVAAQPRALTYSEGVNAVLATRPELWFHPLGTAPHFPTIYPLGYHLLVGALTRLTGLSVFQVMHGVALLSGVGTAAVIYWLIHHQTNHHAPAAVAGAMYLLSPFVTGSTVLGRVDHIGIFLGVLAVAAAVNRGRGDPWLAGGFVVAAMYVKHSLVVFPLAIAGWYWYRGWRRDAVAFTAFTATVGLGLLAALIIATDGRAWMHLVTYNRAQSWYPVNALNLAGWFALVHATLLLAVAVPVVRTRRLRLEGAFFLAALTIAVALAGKIGAWSGYFLPALAAGSLAMGIAVDRWLTPRTTLRWLFVLLVLVGQAGMYATMQPHPEYEQEAQRAALAAVEGADGLVLSVDNGLLVEADKPEVYEAQMLKPLGDDLVAQEARLVGRIERQDFALIVIRTQASGTSLEKRWTREQLDAIHASYRLSAIHGGYYLYTPVERNV